MTDIIIPKSVTPVENLLELQFNPTVDKPTKIKEKDIFDIDKDKKDPTSDNYYPDVALLARQKSMVHKKKMYNLTKTGAQIKDHNR